MSPAPRQLDASVPRDPRGGPHYSRRRRTLSLLDNPGRCERCRAPAAAHAADAVRLVQRQPLGPPCCARRLPYNLTVEVTFSPVVPGPHLIYAREEFASLDLGTSSTQAPAHAEEEPPSTPGRSALLQAIQARRRE